MYSCFVEEYRALLPALMNRSDSGIGFFLLFHPTYVIVIIETWCLSSFISKGIYTTTSISQVIL